MTPVRRGSGREMEATLAPLASEPVAPPPPAFADALEQRLRMVHAVRVADAADRPAAGARRWLGAGIPPRRVSWLAPLALAAAAVIGVVVVTGAGGGPQQTGPTIKVVKAVDAQVIAPDGRAAALHPGARLPDGTVVRTGPTGEVSADGSLLGPDSEAVVHDGHLTLLVPGHRAPAAGRSDHAGASPAPASHGAAAHPGETPTTAGPAPGTHPNPAGASTGPAADHGRGTAPAPPGSSSIQLSAHHGHGHARQLTWSAYDGPNLYGYVVLRATPPAAPGYPRDAIHFIPAGGPPTYSDSPQGDADYQIVAIDSSGGVLASSNIEH